MILDLENKIGDQSLSHLDEKASLEQGLEALRQQVSHLEQLLSSSTQECLKSHELQERMMREYAQLESKNKHLAEAVQLLETRDRESQRSAPKGLHRDLVLTELPNRSVLEEVNSSKADLDDIKQELNQMYKDLGLPQLVISE